MPRCKICKEFIFHSPHKCPPLWKTHIPDYDGEDDWQDTYAFSSEFAATERAVEYDGGDYALLDGGEIEIHVKNANENIIKYICTGEAVPEYRATKIPSDGSSSTERHVAKPNIADKGWNGKKEEKVDRGSNSKISIAHNLAFYDTKKKGLVNAKDS